MSFNHELYFLSTNLTLTGLSGKRSVWYTCPISSPMGYSSLNLWITLASTTYRSCSANLEYHYNQEDYHL